jgi:hypothetical protein
MARAQQDKNNIPLGWVWETILSLKVGSVWRTSVETWQPQ